MLHLAGVGLLLALVQPQDAQERIRRLEERLADLERRHAEEVRALRDEIERLRQEAARPPPGEPEKPPPEVAMGERLAIRSADGRFEWKPRGRLQVDARFYGDPRAPAVLVRAARLGFEGKLHGWIQYVVEGDFGSAGTFTFADAFLDLAFDEAFTARIGRFKEALSVENFTSSRYNFGLERSLMNNWIPQRAVGLEFYGKPFEKRFAYYVGIVSIDGGWDAFGRLVLVPFRDREGPLRGLALGLSGLSGGRLSARPRTLATEVRTALLAFPAATSIRGRDRLVAELAWYNLGPVSLWAEWLWGRDDLRAAGVKRGVPVRGAHVTAGWMLTGEERGPSRVVPRRPVTLKEGGSFGAWEIIARYSALRYGRDVFRRGFAAAAGQARRAQAFTAGLNWFPTSALRIGLDYVHTRFGSRVLLGTRLRRSEDAFLLRFQVEY